MSLSMFGVAPEKYSGLSILEDQIQSAIKTIPTSRQSDKNILQQRLWDVAARVGNAGINMTDDQAESFRIALWGIYDDVNAAMSGTPTTDHTPGFTPGFDDPSKYGSPGYDPRKTNPYYDSNRPGITEVHLSTADQIKHISDSIFGAVSSGAKQLFEIRALAQLKKGQPISVPQSGSGGGISTNEKLAVGGVAVVGIGLLIFALARK